MDLTTDSDIFLEDIQQLRDHGRYQEAVGRLWSDAGKRVLNAAQLALELGQTLRSQGYWAEALKIWQEYLREDTSVTEPSLISIRMRMYVHLMHPTVRENLDGLAANFEQAQRAYEDFTYSKRCEADWEHEVSSKKPTNGLSQ